MNKLMTSLQLAEMLGKDRRKINKNIKDMFQDEIVTGKIFFTTSFNGHVFNYYLPELEAKLFVAKKDINYLEKITQFWSDKNKEITA